MHLRKKTRLSKLPPKVRLRLISHCEPGVSGGARIVSCGHYSIGIFIQEAFSFKPSMVRSAGIAFVRTCQYRPGVEYGLPTARTSRPALRARKTPASARVDDGEDRREYSGSPP